MGGLEIIRRIGRAAVVASLALAGCSDGEGSFTVVFQWPNGQAPAFGSVWIDARVEGRSNPNLPGSPLGGVEEPVEWQPGLALGLDNIPNGENRVVVVEVLNGPERGSQLRYFGLSAPFTLEAGSDVTVVVSLNLEPPPDISDNDVRVINASADNRIRSKVAQLEITASRARRIDVAQDNRFSIGALSFDAADTLQQTLSSSTAVYRVDYNVDEGLDCGGSPAICSDRLTQFFVRVANEQGYASAPFPVRVTIDVAGPNVSEVFFTPPEAKLGDHVFLTLVANEELGSTDPDEIFTWAGGRNPGFVFNSETNRQYVWDFFVTESLAPGEYTLEQINLQDALGNASQTRPVGATLEVDVDEPELDLIVPTVRVGPSGTVEANLVLLEPLARNATVTVGGRLMDCAPSADLLTTDCTYAIDGTEIAADTTDSLSVVAEVEDRAGNRATETRPIVFDFEAPTARTVRVSPRFASEGTRVFLDVSASEPLDAMPTFTFAGPQSVTFDPILVESLDRTWALTVTATVTEGDYALEELVLTDVVGNANIIRFAPQDHPFTVDKIDPEVRNLDVMPARVPAGGLITATFSVSEPSLVLPTVDQERMNCPVNGPDQYECTFMVPTNLPPAETVAAVTVSAVDGAGNQTTTFGSVIIDTLPPEIIEGSEAIDLRPAADNPLGNRISAAGAGTTVLVQFSASEGLMGTPVVTGNAAGLDPLEFTLSQQAGLTYAFEYTVPDNTVASGTYSFSAEMMDLAGNPSTVDIGTLTFDVDTETPPVPDVATSGLIVFERAPWGDSTAPGTPRFGVTGLAGAVEADATVRVSRPFTGEVIRLTADNTGAFADANLPMADTAELRLSAIDAAGNESGTVSVRDGRWTASLGGKVEALVRPNPHAVTRAGFIQPTLIQDELELTTSDYASLSAGASSVQANGLQTWINVTPDGVGPGNRGAGQVAYDSARGRIVIFAGLNNSNTIEWDGQRWFARQTSTSPTPRFNHAMAYDKRRKVSVLFGGQGGPQGRLGDTWEWDGESWRQIAFSGPTPSPRQHVRMAYDERRGVIVLFGGGLLDPNDPSASPNDNQTWEYDGETWTHRTPNLPRSPDPTQIHAMAYDPVQEEIVMIGGLVGFASLTAGRTTWTYDGTTWTPTAPPASGPWPRSMYLNHMVFDRSRGQMILGPGFDVAAQTLRTTETWWAWDGASRTWSVLSTQDLPPRYDYMLGYHEAAEQVVLVGGTEDPLIGTNIIYENDHRVLVDDRWVRITNPVTPPSREMFGFSRAPGDRGLIAYAGSEDWFAWIGSGQTIPILDDVWLFNGWAWESRGAAPSGLGRRWSVRAAYDDQRDAVWLSAGVGQTFGDARGDLWSYDGTTFTQNVAGFGPHLSRFWHSIVYDSDADRVILFGGVSGAKSNDTWIYNPVTNSWSQAPARTTDPEPRQEQIMTYDPVRRKTVMFGGIIDVPGGTASTNDTWIFDLPTLRWTEATPANPPSNRFWTQMVWDPIREKVVLHGGGIGPQQFDDTYEFDGAEWAPVPTLTTGPSIERHELAVSPDGEVYSWGGRNAGQGRNEVWKKRSTTGATAGFRATFDFGEALIDRSAVTAVRVNAQAAGDGGVGGAGAQLDVWQPQDGAWEAVRTNAAATNPGSLNVRLTGPAAQALVDGNDEINVVVRTRASYDNAPQPPAVTLQRLETVVEYRLP